MDSIENRRLYSLIKKVVEEGMERSKRNVSNDTFDQRIEQYLIRRASRKIY